MAIRFLTRCLLPALLVTSILHASVSAQVPQFILTWGTSGSGDGQFSFARRLAIGPDGSVYVADRNQARIQKFTNDGVFLLKWGTPGTGDGQFNFPFGVAVNDSGHVYVAERSNNRIQKFTSDGVFLLKWGTAGIGDGQFNFPVGVAVGPGGDVYVADAFNDRIQKFTSDGVFILKWGGTGTGNGQFGEPVTMAVDSAGHVYVGDSSNFRIQKFTSDGTFITAWGTQGLGDGQFQAPRGIGVDADNNIYVVDQLRNLVQKFTSDGVFVLKWGTVGSGDGQFNRPEDCDVDSAGSVFVTDVSNFRIQKFGVQIVPVTLTFFTVERSGEQAVVSWGANEFVADFIEFHVYRSAPGVARTQITGTALTGSQNYRFVDASPPRDGADYWLLETGSGVDDYWHGPVSLPPGPELALHLETNYPNPFNPATLIRYTVPDAARVILAVYDTRGRLIRTVVDARQPAGTYEAAWDGRDRAGDAVPSGVYFARLRAGSVGQTRKMVLVK